MRPWPSTHRSLWGLLVLLLVGGGLFHLGGGFPRRRTAPPPRAAILPVAYQETPRLSFDGGVDWINTGGRPIRLSDLRGKVVLLDFWTFCCINCHHVLPDLARLEEKYKNGLVVIGVHTPKFDAERDSENLRRKVAEYRIKHPVINDANQVIWNRFEVDSWPTFVLIDPRGQVVAKGSGEGPAKTGALDARIGQLIQLHRQFGGLDETPLKFAPESEKIQPLPLLFPGKVLADAANDRLFITDTGHNRIVIADLKGGMPEVIGSGEEGLRDGSYDRAAFNRPQGLCLVENTLYVADTENHAIRAIGLDAKQVRRVAGTGEQGHQLHAHGAALSTRLSSPWDLVLIPGTHTLAIAMAGHHQIWKLDLKNHTVGVLAGSGMENIINGSPSDAAFAQPSGLATDGQFLYVADSEVSGIRAVSLTDKGTHTTRTVVGVGLFGFGDVDGRGSNVRLQHCLGLAYGDGRLYIADSYNNKIKVCEPQARTVRTFLGNGEPGNSDDPPRFYEPGGLSLAGSKLYIADTNNHAVRVADLKTKVVSTLALNGLKPPAPRPHLPRFLNPLALNTRPVEVANGDKLRLEVKIQPPRGFKLNPEGAMDYLVQVPDDPGALADPSKAVMGKVDPPTDSFAIDVPLAHAPGAGRGLKLKVSVSSFLCSGDSGVCKWQSYIWTVPVRFAEDGTDRISLSNVVKSARSR